MNEVLSGTVRRSTEFLLHYLRRLEEFQSDYDRIIQTMTDGESVVDLNAATRFLREFGHSVRELRLLLKQSGLVMDETEEQFVTLLRTLPTDMQNQILQYMEDMR